MKNFKIAIGFVLFFVACFIVCAIDCFSLGGTIVALFIAFFCGRDGIRIFNKYTEPENID